jgi:signal peptidase I
MINLTRWLLGILQRVTGVTRVEVEGNSMLPTLRHGQRIWVRFYPRALSSDQVLELRGRVVLIEREEYPGIFLIKRLEKVHGDLIWIEGDNKDPVIAELQSDSRKFGWLPRESVRGQALSSR